MGLPVSVLARGSGADSAAAADAVEALFDELRAVDAEFSPYRPGSAISRIIRGELQVGDASDEVRAVAARCERARAVTGGRFDATRPDGCWDPSGLVKGWAVERAVRHLVEAGPGTPGPAVDWCVNAGGDVMVVTPSGIPFTVGIQDPRDAGAVSATVTCAGGAVATSGTAARGAHLYDPRSGAAVVGGWLSVTVVGPSLEWADVLATAAFVAADGWAEVVSAVPGYEALGIDGSGALSTTPQWPHQL